MSIAEKLIRAKGLKKEDAKMSLTIDSLPMKIGMKINTKPLIKT